MRKTESQKIALCGVLSALSVVVLLVGNVLQIGTYAAPMLASFLLIPTLGVRISLYWEESARFTFAVGS